MAANVLRRIYPRSPEHRNNLQGVRFEKQIQADRSPPANRDFLPASLFQAGDREYRFCLEGTRLQPSLRR